MEDEDERNRALRKKVIVEVALKPVCLVMLAIAILCMVVVVAFQGIGLAFLASLAASCVAFVLGVRWTL